MKINKLTLTSLCYPEPLRHIPSPPKQLFTKGAPLGEMLKMPRVALVGSRRPTPYGKYVTEQLASELAGQGIIIVSGLALGIDAIAHRAALASGGTCIAVLPGPVGRVYPATNRRLAEEILASNGVLVSEYDEGAVSFKQNFIARNRIVAGLSQVILITEATEKSGSLHTARFALEQGKDVLAVPGNIDSPPSVGTNNLIRAGATPITSCSDVLQVLGLEPHTGRPQTIRGRNADEQRIIDLLLLGVYSGHELFQRSKLPASRFNQALTMLEIGGKIRPTGGNQWRIR
ncbi:MAG TPA: DNA-processing protein DprA [Candidatus Saccharimonadales bacterium]|nr:DNA-processing protein DprA [Candidatus Saccharimonadales bacterium]